MRAFIACLALLLATSPALGFNAGQVLQYQNTHQCPHCDLSHVNLTGCKIKQKGPNCSLHSDLSYANLAFANLSKAEFITCIRGYVTPLAKATFYKANFAHAKLLQSKFYGVNLASVTLRYANLRQAEFFMADLSYSDFTYANLKNVVSKRDAMHGWGSDFTGCDFEFANLREADLFGNFAQANFSHAILVNAKLSSYPQTILWKDNYKHGDGWQGVNFTDANLSGATLAPSDLSKAILCRTIMPDGKINNRNCQ